MGWKILEFYKKCDKKMGIGYVYYEISTRVCGPSFVSMNKDVTK